MEFFNRVTRWDSFNRIKKVCELKNAPSNAMDFYRDYIKHAADHSCNEWTLAVEMMWYKLMRPYFNVWPPVLSIIDSLNLDIPWSALTFSRQTMTLLLRFQNPGFESCGSNVRHILFSLVPFDRESSPLETGLFFTWDVGEIDESGIPVYQYLSIPVGSPNEKISDTLDASNGMFETSCHQVPLTRVMASVLLIANDPSLISSDVLAKDRVKFEDPKTTLEQQQAIIDRAHRRGKIGWDIGKNIEVSPHFRRPHFAIRWTGKGKETPKVVPVSGCVVKRVLASKVPTGYLSKEESNE